MGTINRFFAWWKETFQKQGIVGKVVLGCSSLFVICWLCSVPIVILSPKSPATATSAVASTPLATQVVELPTNTAIVNNSGQCDPGDQIPYVYHPDRLIVLKSCIHVTGVVVDVRDEEDGDLHILLNLDLPYVNLLTSANADELGALVVEPVCVSTPTQASALGICNGNTTALTDFPSIGQHIWMEGQYVTDSEHGGWAEIHPLARWGLIDQTSSPQVVLPTQTKNSGSGNCDPSYPTVCIPPAPPDLDCKDVPYRRFQVLPPDPHRFDRDHDGIGCES